ncbi:MAG TPA: hypothetical protein VGK09_07970 [Rhodocyclaceae bacterium]
MAEITQETIEEIENEYAKWAEFLNVGVGLLSFSLGISCIGTPRPDITADLSLFFMLLFMMYGQKHFPKRLRELRRASLVGVDEILLLGIERKYFGIRGLCRNFPVFLAGWLFLGSVAIYGAFFK